MLKTVTRGVDMRTRRTAICLFVFLLTSFAMGTPMDLAMQSALDHYRTTIGEAQKYTYTELYQNLNYDSSGTETQNFTETYDVIFLEGAPYKKHTMHNGKPLSEKDQRQEDKKENDISKERLKGEKDKRGLFNASFHFELPLDQLHSRFETSSQPAQEVDGRTNLRFDAVPKGYPQDVKQIAKDGLAYEMKFWVDQQDGVFTKIEAKVISEKMRYEKDSVITYEWKKINDEAWLPSHLSFKGKVRYMMHDVPAESIYTYSGYKKFRADTKIVTP